MLIKVVIFMDLIIKVYPKIHTLLKMLYLQIFK